MWWRDDDEDEDDDNEDVEGRNKKSTSAGKATNEINFGNTKFSKSKTAFKNE